MKCVISHARQPTTRLLLEGGGGGGEPQVQNFSRRACSSTREPLNVGSKLPWRGVVEERSCFPDDIESTWPFSLYAGVRVGGRRTLWGRRDAAFLWYCDAQPGGMMTALRGDGGLHDWELHPRGWKFIFGRENFTPAVCRGDRYALLVGTGAFLLL